MICGTVRFWKMRWLKRCARYASCGRRVTVAGQALAGLALGDAEAGRECRGRRCQLQKRGFVQQAFEVERRLFADQFQLEREGWLMASRPVRERTWKSSSHRGQAEVGLVGRCEHPCSSCSAATRNSPQGALAKILGSECARPAMLPVRYNFSRN
jgi:hypothetical protein